MDKKIAYLLVDLGATRSWHDQFRAEQLGEFPDILKLGKRSSKQLKKFVEPTERFTKQRKTEAYGSYDQYSSNIRKLCEQLLGYEGIIIYSLSSKNFDVHAMTMFPVQLGGHLISAFEKSDIWVARRDEKDNMPLARSMGYDKFYEENKFNTHRLFPELKQKGIEEILVAGEWAWINFPAGKPPGPIIVAGRTIDPESADYFGLYEKPKASSLSRVADRFVQEGFGVRGISGCVYPLKEAAAEGIQLQLYRDGVTMKELEPVGRA